MTTMQHIANAGYLLQTGGRRILVDPFCTTRELYQNPPDRMLEALVRGEGDFGNIDLLLQTHDHPDHFDLDLTVRLMQNQPGLLLVGPTDAVARIHRADPRANCRAVDLRLYRCGTIRAAGLDITAMRTLHLGQEYARIIHLSYYIHGTNSVLVTGDAKPSKENYSPFHGERPISVLIAAYPYVTLKSARKLVGEALRPEVVLINHIPSHEKEGRDLYELSVRQVEQAREQGMPVRRLYRPGERWKLDGTAPPPERHYKQKG